MAGHGSACSDLRVGIFLVSASHIRIPTNAFASDSRQDPYEVILPVRICAGGRWQQRSLPRFQLIEFASVNTGPVPVLFPKKSQCFIFRR